MMESNEPPFIKYEEIPLSDDYVEMKHDDSDISNSSSDEELDDEEETEDPNKLLASVTADEEKYAQSVRSKTISRILDFIFAPRKIVKDGKNYLLRLSREAASRDEIVELSKTFEKYLKERQARMKGYCPVRRELYDLLFDELIRQATINCAERGSLLLRVRDEFRMTMMAYEKLYENGVSFGSRKAMEAELNQHKVELEYKQLKAEVLNAENHIKDIQAQIEAMKLESKQRMDLKKARHEEKMEFLKKLNRQLKEQIAIIV